jgi:tetratricopeptide (TPR) repeat protein
VSPRLQYYLGRTLEALGRKAEAAQAFERGLAGMEALSGDRDSWNSENYFMVASLERLGRKAEAEKLEKRFEAFALGEADSKNAEHKAEARYLLGLVMTRRGDGDEGKRLIGSAIEARPDLTAARLELRGDTLSVGEAAR